MIRTVNGDILKDKLGITMAHEHFIVDLDRVRKDGVSKIETVDEVVPEIKKMMELGVESAFEVTTNDMGRDPLKLKEISDITGLNIVCSTGFYLSEYHPDKLNDMSKEEIACIYIKDLTEGIDNTGIKAGLIGEIASNKTSFIGNEKKILEAAGIASVKTGSAISTHTGKFTAMETIDILLKEGVNPDKVIIGHQDLIDDTNYHISLLQRGINIGFDTCGKSAYVKDEIRASNIMKLIEKGYGDHIVLSNDVSRRTYFTSYNQNGYLSVMNIVVPLLKEYGINDTDLHKLLVENPSRIVDNDWR
jgi:phosphotriesterase-related protein